MAAGRGPRRRGAGADGPHHVHAAGAAVTAPTVDVHATSCCPRPGHWSPGGRGSPGRAPDARRNGAAALAVSGSMVRERMPRMTDSGVRLAAMDAQRVDVQLISPSPSHYHYWADEETAEKVCRLANEATAAHCSAAPDRLRGLGLVPLQHPDLMVRALDDALDQGLGRSGDFQPRSGAGTHRSGLRAFWARAEATGALVFLRPFGCTLDERLDRWYLPNTVGQPTENAVALPHLIFSGVLDRHPGLKPVAAHGGGCLPTHIGRGDEGRASAPARARTPPSPSAPTSSRPTSWTRTGTPAVSCVSP
nr:amidohydrolase family protein [Streptomyces sp. Ru87]